MASIKHADRSASENGKAPQNRDRSDKFEVSTLPPEEELEEGECSDSDALLPPRRRALSEESALALNTKNGSPVRKSSSTEADFMEVFLEEGEDFSPLLRCGKTGSDTHQMPPQKHSTTDTMATDRANANQSSDLMNEKDRSFRSKKEEDNHTNSETIFIQTDEHPLSSTETMPECPPATESIHQPYDMQIPSARETTATNSISHRRRKSNRRSRFSEEHADLVPTSNSSNSSITTGTPASTSTASNSANYRHSLDMGMGALRRWIRNRAPHLRNPSTTDSTASQRSNTTLSLGDEDLFALSMIGEDPRTSTTNSHESSSMDLQNPPRFTASYNNFPPIVWEEGDDSSESETVEGGGRRRTYSEPNGNRIRDFLFQRAVTPAGVRRRNSNRIRRQYRSVRSHLPGASSPASPAGGLSTSAAAVLFTSSQSQASTDLFQEQQQSPRILPQHHYQIPGTTTAASTSTGIDSIIASGTVDHSSPMNGGGASVDTISISTMGNSHSPNASNDINNESHTRSSPPLRVGSGAAVAPTEAVNSDGANNENGGGNGNNSTADDASREARARWVQINSRFQLMVTVVAILFSLLLFSILICWIVLTSAYVVTFEKNCDVPLKGFYWLVTLQLLLDVFRQDIMRHILRWDPASQPAISQQVIPTRVMLYNLGYFAYALLVLRMGINAVYIDGQRDSSTCQQTAPELFQAGFVFVTLTLAAWATVILGYFVPFCFVASLLTLNGFNPADASASGIGTGVFPSAISNNGAPPGCIEQLREVNFAEEDNLPTECCICMEEFGTGRNADDVVVSTDCRHIFHRNCCAVWLRQARTCPVCRTDIPEAQEQRRRQEQQSGEAQPQLEVNQHDGSAQGGADLEQQPVPASPPQHPRRHRSRTTLSPPLPFVAAGSNDVATLFRAFHRRPRGQRQQHRRRSHQRGDTATASNSSRPQQRQREQTHNPPRDETIADNTGHELTAMNPTSSTPTNAIETRTVNGSADEEAQFVM